MSFCSRRAIPNKVVNASIISTELDKKYKQDSSVVSEWVKDLTQDKDNPGEKDSSVNRLGESESRVPGESENKFEECISQEDLSHSVEETRTRESILEELSANVEECSRPNVREAFSKLPDAWKQDKLVALKAIDLDPTGRVLRALPETLREDREIVLKAVGKIGTSLEYVQSDLLKNDREVALVAVTQTTRAFKHVGKELKRNREFIIEMLQGLVSCRSGNTCSQKVPWLHWNTCVTEPLDRRKDFENCSERVLGYAVYSSHDYEDNNDVILRLSEETDMPRQGEILEWRSPLEFAIPIGILELLTQARTFCVGERVQFKDDEDEDWTYGIVASTQPLSVRLGLKDEENAEQWDEVIKHPKKKKETREALSILGSFGAAAVQHAALVASCLCDSDLDVRVEASKVLKAMGAQAVDHIDTIVACLADTHSDVREQALIVLGGFGPDASCYADVIACCLCDSNVIVRVEASKALEAIGAHVVDHIDAIVACLANTKVKVRKGALSVLSSFDQERLSSLTRSLCAMLGDVDEDVRDSAFEMLLHSRTDIAHHIAFFVKEWTVTRHRSDTITIRHVLEAVGRMVMNQRYEIVGLHAVTYLRCLKRSLGNNTVDDMHIRFLVKSIFIELDLHVVASLETIVNVAAFAEDALVRKQALEILHELHSRDKSLFIEGSPGGCLGKLILSCSEFDESGSYELLDEMLSLDWDRTCRWELACASLFKAQAMAQTLHPCLKSDCGSLLSQIKSVLSVAMQPPMELRDLVDIEVDSSDEPSWSGLASDYHLALPIMEVLRHDFANVINGLLTLQDPGASSQTQEVVAKVLDVALNANGGCGFCVAPRSEIDALANTDGIQFTVADKRKPEYKHGYMSHRLRHVSVHDVKFLEAVQDFSCEHQVADPAYHDKYPPGHEAAGLPTDGFFIIDVEQKPGYIIKAATRIEGLPASTIVWDGVGLRHKSGLHLSWALRKAFSLVIVASASGKVTALVSDLYGVVAVRCRP